MRGREKWKSSHESEKSLAQPGTSCGSQESQRGTRNPLWKCQSGGRRFLGPEAGRIPPPPRGRPAQDPRPRARFQAGVTAGRSSLSTSFFLSVLLPTSPVGRLHGVMCGVKELIVTIFLIKCLLFCFP